LPLSIQNWPACERTIGGLGPYGDLAEWVTVRGVPGSFHDRYRQLKLTTGGTTIFLSGPGREFLLAAARSLQGVNARVGPSEKLPRPAPGALEGRFEC
jgi:hypothetical protein